MMVVKMLPCDSLRRIVFSNNQVFSNSQDEEGWQTFRTGHRFRAVGVAASAPQLE
jgi:hypothetical protein